MNTLSFKGLAYGKEEKFLGLKEKDPILFQEFFDILLETCSDRAIVAHSGQIMLIARRGMG